MIYQFILTSRSKFIADRPLSVTLTLKIGLYDLDNVYLLIDQLLEDSGKVIAFHASIRNASFSNDEIDILKFPWLVIFIIEHFRENSALSHEFFLTLATEIFFSLQHKLRMPGRRMPSKKIEQTTYGLGAFIFKKMLER